MQKQCLEKKGGKVLFHHIHWEHLAHLMNGYTLNFNHWKSLKFSENSLSVNIAPLKKSRGSILIEIQLIFTEPQRLSVIQECKLANFLIFEKKYIIRIRLEKRAEIEF